MRTGPLAKMCRTLLYSDKKLVVDRACVAAVNEINFYLWMRTDEAITLREYHVRLNVTKKVVQ